MNLISSRRGNAALYTCNVRGSTAGEIQFFSLIAKGHGLARPTESNNKGGVSTLAKIKDKVLAANGIELVLLDLETEGWYIPSLKTIFINKGLDEAKQQEIIKAIKERERIGE